MPLPLFSLPCHEQRQQGQQGRALAPVPRCSLTDTHVGHSSRAWRGCWECHTHPREGTEGVCWRAPQGTPLTGWNGSNSPWLPRRAGSACAASGRNLRSPRARSSTRHQRRWGRRLGRDAEPNSRPGAAPEHKQLSWDVVARAGPGVGAPGEGWSWARPGMSPCHLRDVPVPPQGCHCATSGMSPCHRLQPCSLASLHSARGQGWGEAKRGQAGAGRGKCRHRPYGFWSFSTKGFWGGGCFISRFFWKGFGLISSSAKH